MNPLIWELVIGLAIIVGTIIGGIQLLEKQRERKRPIVRDILEKEVYRSLDVIDHNREFLKNEDTDWMEVTTGWENSDDVLRSELRALSLRDSDQIVSERFAEMYPNKIDMLNRHDELLVAIEDNAVELIRSCRDPLKEYIGYRELTNEDGSNVDEEEILNYILIGDRPTRYDDRPTYWEEYALEIKTICASHAPKAYENFSTKEREYKNFTNKVKRELTEIRDQLERKYGVARYD